MNKVMKVKLSFEAKSQISLAINTAKFFQFRIQWKQFEKLNIACKKQQLQDFTVQEAGFKP